MKQVVDMVFCQGKYCNVMLGPAELAFDKLEIRKLTLSSVVKLPENFLLSVILKK